MLLFLDFHAGGGVNAASLVDGFDAGGFFGGLDGRCLLSGSFAAEADRRVDGDAEQPGVELRVASEGIQLAERVDEGFLGEITGVFRRLDHQHQRVVQPVLVAHDEPTERVRIARERLLDQFLVVFGSQRMRAALNAESNSWRNLTTRRRR